MLQGFNPLDYFGTMTWQHTQRDHAAAAHGTSAVGARDGREPLQLLRADPGRPLGDLHPDAPPPGPRAAAGRSAWSTRSTTRASPSSRSSPRAEDAQAWEDLLWEAMAAAPVRTLGEGLPGRSRTSRSSSPGSARRASTTSRSATTGRPSPCQDPTRGPVEQIGPIARFAATPSRIDRVGTAARRSTPATSPRCRPRTDRTARRREHPLAGVTIVELGYFYAMPYGVTMAGALGARVIKLEGTTRRSDAHLASASAETGAREDDGGQGEPRRRPADARGPADRAGGSWPRRTCSSTGSAPASPSGWASDYATLSKLNPRLVYVHAAGYGIDGPFAHRPIYAQVAQAVAGSIGRYGGRWLDPELTKSHELDRGPGRGAAAAAGPGRRRLERRARRAVVDPVSRCTTSGAPARASSCRPR